MWMLGIEPRSSGRAVSALNRWAISPAPPGRAIYLACTQHAVFPWILPFGSNKDRPHPAPGALTGKVECFSDYMTLQIQRNQVQGLRQWLARVLHLPGTKRVPNHLDSLLAKCGFLLHPAHEGGFIFRVLYSGCFVQREKANYRLEIRMFQKGAKRLKQSDRYIMKCPMITSRLGEQRVRCYPSHIQVSRPLPPRIDGGQTPWLLSLRGELVASLEDASLMGLDVDIGATTVTIQSPRQELLQRQEVRNTSLELLPLWLVSGSYAYSLKAACPLASSQPGSEILVHIPKQRLGLVRRGSRVEESLSLRFLRVRQSNTFTVTEDRDFIVVRIPAPLLLQDQPCPEVRESPGTRTFYRIDLSLAFAEMVSPVHWTVENFFQCVAGTGSTIHANSWTGRRKMGVRCFHFPQYDARASWSSDSSKESRLNSTSPDSSDTLLRAHGSFPGCPQILTMGLPVSHFHDHTFAFRSPLSSGAFWAICWASNAPGF
ncbi:hypothetical protein STEG23_008989 [Scotinomys teguina]